MSRDRLFKSFFTVAVLGAADLADGESVLTFGSSAETEGIFHPLVSVHDDLTTHPVVSWRGAVHTRLVH